MMLDIATKKTKIHLEDYDYLLDIETRHLLARLTEGQREILEELLFSPLKTSPHKISRSLNMTPEYVLETLSLLEPAALFSMKDGVLLIDKEKRKYFELQAARFQSNFVPDMEFFQKLLKKPPIHVLPLWYAIPRTSNNIFESIVEKHLKNPQLYQRHLIEVSTIDPKLGALIADLSSAPAWKIPSEDLLSRHHLSRQDFDRLSLLLEFSCVGCITYEMDAGGPTEYLSFFSEWRDYQAFLQTTQPQPVSSNHGALSTSSPFAFVEALSRALTEPRSLSVPAEIQSQIEGCHLNHREVGQWFLSLTLEERCLWLYRHSFNQKLESSLSMEKRIREVEKGVRRILHGSWVRVEDFFKGLAIPVRCPGPITLLKQGKHWSYAVPKYDEEEISFIQELFLRHLPKMGIIQVGTLDDLTACLRLTPLGVSLFSE
jgi:hypothetical protein